MAIKKFLEAVLARLYEPGWLPALLLVLGFCLGYNDRINNALLSNGGYDSIGMFFLGLIGLPLVVLLIAVLCAVTRGTKVGNIAALFLAFFIALELGITFDQFHMLN